jgi:anaerobic ribonucleoside-triphosphate reductase
VSEKVKKSIELINREIDYATGPDIASKEEAVEILEQVITDAEAKLDALKDEMQRGK